MDSTLRLSTEMTSSPPINLERLCGLLQQQRRLLSHAAALQPSPGISGRSFSQPELRTVADGNEPLFDYKTFRDQLLEKTTTFKPWPSKPCDCKSRTDSTAAVKQTEDFEEPPYSGKSSLRTLDYDALQMPLGGSSIYSTSDDTTNNSSCSPSTPPVPKPRKSVQHRRTKKVVVVDKKDEVKPAHEDPPNNVPKESIEPKCLPVSPKPPQLPSLLIPSEQTTILPNNGHSNSNLPNHHLRSPPKAKVKTKAHSFRQQLLRINRIASNKLLSIRLKSTTTTGTESLPGRKRLSSQLFFGFSSDKKEHQQQPYRRPTRTPPPTPILIFRPPAPLPCELPPSKEGGGDDPASSSTPEQPRNRWWTTNSSSGHPHRHLRYLLLGQSSSSPSTLYDCEAGNGYDHNDQDEDDISELYHDAALLEAEEEEEEGNDKGKNDDLESIYCSVDESSNIGDKKDIEKDEEEEVEEDEDYYDDGEECIYEELSSIYEDGTIYEDYLQEQEEEENVYDNADALPPLPPLPPPNAERQEDLEEMTSAERQMKKRLKKLEKAMRRFKLTGEEIPLSAGIVKRDQRGGGAFPASKLSRLDTVKALVPAEGGMLKVRAGETVLILRIEGNPPGLWLGKNERSKIGYVDCNNVYFDTESIKAVITGFHNS